MNLYLLVKFGEKIHLESLQKTGQIFCQTLKYFADLEEKKVRGDLYESAIELQYMENTKIYLRPADKIEEEFKYINVLHGQIRKSYDQPLGNVYCMSKLRFEMELEPLIYRFDERFKGFGTHFLLIKHQPIFFERLSSALKKLAIKYCVGDVQYLDLRKYSGKKNCFQKDLFHSWQEEFRIFFQTSKIQPFDFHIGSLEDISEIYEIEKVPKLDIKHGHKRFGPERT
jgi:hypothetical protein